MHRAVETTFSQQDEIMERSISLAKQFHTNKVRCFDFWRLDNIAPYHAAIEEKLRSAAEAEGMHALSDASKALTTMWASVKLSIEVGP